MGYMPARSVTAAPTRSAARHVASAAAVNPACPANPRAWASQGKRWLGGVLHVFLLRVRMDADLASEHVWEVGACRGICEAHLPQPARCHAGLDRDCEEVHDFVRVVSENMGAEDHVRPLLDYDLEP